MPLAATALREEAAAAAGGEQDIEPGQLLDISRATVPWPATTRASFVGWTTA